MFYYWLAPLGKQFILFNLFGGDYQTKAGAMIDRLLAELGH